MHIILTGATGLVGSAALTSALTPSSISKISILARRTSIPLAANHDNVKIIQHADFLSYPPSLLEQLEGAEACIWALGVSANDVSKDEYERITVHYTLAAAKAFASLHQNFRFVFVSGEGATTQPGRFTPLFGRVKGHAEQALLTLPSESPYASIRPYAVRPAWVDAGKQPEIVPQHVPWGLSKRITEAFVGPMCRVVMPSFVTPTKQLGKLLTDLAIGDGKPMEGKGIEEGRTIRNIGIRRLTGW